MTSLRGTLREHVSLASHTSWRVGGPAALCYQPADSEDLIHFLTQSTVKPITFLGLGSNVLIRDGGIPGVTILTQGALNGLMQAGSETIHAEAGVTCAKLARFCARAGLQGGAFFAGVPGTVGGALRMNAGAFGGETWPHVVEVETVNKAGKRVIRTPKEYEVAYRQIKGKHHDIENEWFLAATFHFERDLRDAASEDIKILLRKRNKTQPIGQLSCGSVFRNPPGDYAARLIEASGLKGFQIGDAIVSEKHANFIINQGHATAKHIEQLIQHVEETVAAKQGVHLVREVHILGEAE